MRIPRRISEWAYGLFGGCIGGGAASFLSWASMAGAKAAGLDVPVLNFKAAGVIFLSGVVTHGMMFLAKSPLPPLDTSTETLAPKAP